MEEIWGIRLIRNSINRVAPVYVAFTSVVALGSITAIYTSVTCKKSASSLTLSASTARPLRRIGSYMTESLVSYKIRNNSSVPVQNR